MTNKYTKGVYSTQGHTLHDMAVSVLQDAALQYNCVTTWVLDSGLSNITTNAYLPEATHAELLQIIAQAAGMTLKYNRNGEIIIEPAAVDSQHSQGTIKRFNFLDYPKSAVSDRIGILNTKIHTYTQEKVEIPSNHFPNVTGCIMEPVRNYVTMQDWVAIQTAASKIGEGEPTGLTPEQETRADCNMDGSITAVDASIIAEFPSSVGSGKYTNDLPGWELYYNDKIGTKKIIAQTSVTLNPNESTKVIINHGAAYDVSVSALMSTRISSMESYANVTVLTFLPRAGTFNVILYGYPITENSTDFQLTVENWNETIEGIDNPIITNNNMALNCVNFVKDWVRNTETINLPSYRADPAFDVGAAYINDTLVYITNIQYNFTGMFRGTADARVIEVTA